MGLEDFPRPFVVLLHGWRIADMAQLRFFLFGTPRLKRRGEPLDLGLRKAMALLAYLVVKKEEHSRDELATLLWPESDQSSARASLRRTLYLINRTLGEGILTTGADTIRLDPRVEIWTDVGLFQQHLRECSPQGESQENITVRCLSVLKEAVALYKADLLAGFTLPDCLSFDEWLFFEAEGLRKSLARVLRQLAAAYRTQGDFERAIQHARRWLALDPLHEPAHQLLMSLYAESGQQAAALRQYTECARLLDRELGLPPLAETAELYRNIRLQRETPTPQPPKARPPVKYVCSGDVHIAYQVLGEGPVDILHICGYLSTLEHFWELPDSAAFVGELASFSRLILLDRRGGGLSERVGYPPTLEDTVDDILAVMRAAGSKHPVLFGTTEAGANCMLFAATHPGRVSGLILYGTQAKWTRSEDYPWALTRELWDVLFKRHTANWGQPLNIELYAPSRAQDPQLREWWAKALRTGSSPGAMKAMLEVMQDIDVRDILPAIRTPTLVLHRKCDRGVFVGNGRYLAGQIPGARYVELEGQDHFWWIGDTQSILREIRSFVHNLDSPVAPKRMLATILLVEVMEGDAQGTSPPAPIHLDTTYAFLHQELARFRGSEVRWSQGHYTATFDGPSRAINCAKSIVESLSQRDIPVRAGLHTGECEFAAGELVGTTVLIAKGVLRTTPLNQVLVSSTVRDLVAGSGFQYAEGRQCAIEGISRAWTVFPVI
jgi:DNA-binding SARP family transcriptional activator/pimeloyl-ACP methyl ester carboxylesterase